MKQNMRIGIFAGKVYRDINRLQLYGILSQAFSLGYSASVFTLNEEYYDERTDKGECNLLNIVNFNKLDGIIYLPNAFSSDKYRDQIREFLTEKCTVPIVCTDIEPEPFISVWYDDRSESKAIIKHLIEKHGCRKILYMTGPENLGDSHQRLAGYKDAMNEADLEYSDDDIIFGDFWIHSGQKLGNEIISGKRPIPDAIACANDCMAISLCDTLTSNGFRVPEDVLITGYDGTAAAALHSPTIATYRSSWKLLGAKAMCRLYKEMTGCEAEEIHTEDGEVVCGESCSCGMAKNNPYSVSFNYERFEGDYQDSSISTILLSAKNYKDFINELYILVPKFLDAENEKNMHYCLCLCEDWRKNQLDGYKDTYRTSGYSERIFATDTIEKHTVFDAADMLPAHITDKGPSVTYFSPCHFSDRCFGYNTITFYGEADSFDLKYLRFCREVNNALAFLVIQDELKGLAYSSHIAQSRDLLTGLYNLESLPRMWTEISETAAMHNEDIYIIAISLSGLQQLLEISSTREKEKLLVAFSEMLMKCCDGREKLFRLGDGDFAVIGSERSTQKKHISITDKIDNRFIELDHVSEFSGSVHINHKTHIIESNELPDTDSARQLLLELIDSLNDNHPSRTEQLYYKELVVLRREIYEFPGNDWNLSMCCEKLNISNTYFQKIYKKTFGVTCTHDIQRSKLDYAKKLLTHTNDTLQIIAERCGYDYSHFMRIFKKETGLTPTEYRRGKSV